MKQFTKKPVTISAIQMPGYGEEPSEELMGLVEEHGWVGEGENLIIRTPEGHRIARPDDWIIRDTDGEFHRCEPDIFKATYVDAFDLSGQPTAPMSFGWAIGAMRFGHKVARAGWNGRGMWIALTPESLLYPDEVPEDHAVKHRAAEVELENDKNPSGYKQVRILPHIDMCTEDGSMIIGWIPSQVDMMAEDWRIVE